MKFEWDERKRQRNLRKHGIDFVQCVRIFDGLTKTILDCRRDYGEQRFVTLGILEGRVVAVAHAETPDKIRIISARKASKHEQALFFEGI